MAYRLVRHPPRSVGLRSNHGPPELLQSAFKNRSLRWGRTRAISDVCVVYIGVVSIRFSHSMAAIFHESHQRARTFGRRSLARIDGGTHGPKVHAAPSASSRSGSSEQRLGSTAWRRVPLRLDLGLLLREGLSKRQRLAITIRVRFVPSKLGLAELIKVFATRGRVIGVVHSHVCRGLTALSRDLEVLGVAAFEDIDLRVVDLGVDVVVHRAVLRAEMLCAEDGRMIRISSTLIEGRYSQCRRPLSAELAMENENRLPRLVATDRRAGFSQAVAE